MPLTPTEHARLAARGRWDRDPRGIDRRIDDLVSRSSAITPQQRDRLAHLVVTVGPALPPALAATIAQAARNRTVDLAADGPIDPAVLDEVRALLGPISKTATDPVEAA